jgi:hypothetical protein
MSNPNLDRSYEPSPLSMIGGAAQGGSAKPKQEREELDRQNEQRQEDTPAGAGESSRKGTVGGNSNDHRTDQDRAADAPGE